MRQIPVITKNLLIINVLAFMATFVFGLKGINLEQMLGLHFVLAPDFRLWQPITYMFMHANITHLFFNMFALWMFGCTLERAWGEKNFLFFTLACGFGAGLFQEVAQFVSYAVQGLAAYDSVNLGNGVIMPMSSYLNMWNTVGFSGAVYGILLGFGMTYPEERIFVFPIPVPIKGKWFVAIYAAIEFFSTFGMRGDGVAHIAHLGGMVIGFFIILYWRNHNSGSGFNGWDGYEIKNEKSTVQKIKDWFGKIGKKKIFTKDDIHFGGSDRNADWDYNVKQKKEDEEIDRILDKIRKSGYESLSDVEKKRLFDRK